MRQRLLAYFTAACINLSIVTGTLTPPLVVPPPIVRIRQRVAMRGRFAAGEVAPDGSVATRKTDARSAMFSAN
jgi:hypothetical protein